MRAVNTRTVKSIWAYIISYCVRQTNTIAWLQKLIVKKRDYFSSVKLFEEELDATPPAAFIIKLRVAPSFLFLASRLLYVLLPMKVLVFAKNKADAPN